MKHYHVVAGLRGGYIPNTDEVYETKAIATSAALDMVAEYRDSGEKVHGNARRGYWVAREGIFPGEFYDFVRVDACTEPQCADLPALDQE